MKTRSLNLKFFFLLSILMVLACSAPVRLIEELGVRGTPTAPAPTIEANSLPERDPKPGTALSTLPPEVGGPDEKLPQEEGFACSYNPLIAGLFEQTSPEHWIEWVEKLSGAQPVEIAGEQVTIETRYSVAMFEGRENARAFEWLEQQVREWYPDEQIEVMPFNVQADDQRFTWKNLILTLPGKTHPEEVVLLTAHLDSMSQSPLESAPGAEDNASGTAALLEAARLFRDVEFERTVQVIWFTGEEQGLLGSEAYTRQMNLDQVLGVVNLDMFGYDSDNDRCFELHVGRLPESNEIGQCFVDTIASYELDLTYDYLTDQATSRSDHGSFWREGVGAVEVLEDLFANSLPNGCPARDANPDYHTTNDVASNLNPETGFEIMKAALGTLASMAQPIEE